MARMLADYSAETKLKAANIVAVIVPDWTPQSRYLTDAVASMSPDPETRDAAVTAINEYAQRLRKFEDWEDYQTKVLTYVPQVSSSDLALEIIGLLTR